MTQYHPVPAALSPRARIARAFSRSAASYDAHADLQRTVADKLLTMLPSPVAAGVMLDLGCGTGYCTQRVRTLAPAASLLALDLAEPMLQRARSVPEVLPLCADAQQIPLRAQSVDVIVSSLTIQWCSDHAALFSELQRVLKPGGVALLSTLGPRSLHELRAAWAGIDSGVHSNQFVAAPALVAAAEAAGLAVQCSQEMHVRHHDSLRALAQELKGLGANAVLQPALRGVSPAAFRAAEAAFARGRTALGIPVQWEVIYLQLQRSSS